jgi:hypothetical protein
MACIALLAPAKVRACNIPVFRYALERWHPDFVELVLFADDVAAPSEKQLLRSLGDKPADDVTANAKVQIVLESHRGPFEELWTTLSSNAEINLPHLVLRTKLNDRTVNSWHADLAVAEQANLLDSPKRQALRERLLQGDAIVWLLLKSKDEAKNKAVRTTLQAEFKKLSKTLKLPDGIGLPGSELYADVPLVLDFSVLEIDPNDKQETYLSELLKGFHPKAYAQGAPLVAPVFGRGRILEVLPADAIDGKLVGELTTFLCGACSCKVKGLNPGFDLLMTTNWDVHLFGEDGERPNADGPSDETPLPTLITIPPGRKDR